MTSATDHTGRRIAVRTREHLETTPAHPGDELLVSVIVLNYNGARWLERCLSSLREQTIASRLEVIVADNQSSDGSDRLAAELVKSCPSGRFIQHGENLGYCAGNNRAAEHARGRFLFFLNNDTWLEPDCLERLVEVVLDREASAACPLVLNYDDDSFQSLGMGGFDVFGFPTSRVAHETTQPVFMPEGCAYLIDRTLFGRLGGFDSEYFMYLDEYDLSWRLWAAGCTALAVPSARLHHRGAAQVNPTGGGTIVEFRTSDAKRFYGGRNALLTVLKNAQSLFFLMLPAQLFLLALEALVGLVLVRRWSFVKRAYIDAVADCWRLRPHIAAERRRMRALRQRGDWQLLKFLRLTPNRWYEIQKMREFGVPRVTAG